MDTELLVQAVRSFVPSDKISAFDAFVTVSVNMDQLSELAAGYLTGHYENLQVQEATQDVITALERYMETL